MDKIEKYVAYLLMDYINDDEYTQLKEELTHKLSSQVQIFIDEGFTLEEAIQKTIYDIETNRQYLKKKENKNAVELMKDRIDHNIEVFHDSIIRIAFKIAFGVLFIIIAFAASEYIGTINEEAYRVYASAYFFLAFIFSIPLFILAGLESSKYAFTLSEKDYDIYEGDEIQQYIVHVQMNEKRKQNKYFYLLISGIILIAITVVIARLVLHLDELLNGAVFLTVVAIAISLIIFSSISLSLAPSLHQKKKENKPVKQIHSYSPYILPIASIIYLLIGFILNAWHPGWIVFILAAAWVAYLEIK